MTDSELVAIALKMREKSYCPYSRFAVGAALECSDGSVYTGCNIENAAFSPSICAERAAAAKAVSDGKRSFARIAVAGSSDEKCTPCGVCRQVLSEFSPDMVVLCADASGGFDRVSLSELLPRRFGRESL
jgi:cytidine deaminase